jgi:hypothetical protein
MFNTLQYAKRLKEVGFTEAQAEVQAEALAGLIEGSPRSETSRNWRRGSN